MLDMHERLLGSEHADSLAIMSELASMYEANKQWSMAEEQYARLAELKRKSLGDRDPETLVVETMHARVIAKQGHKRAEDSQRILYEVIMRGMPVLESIHRWMTMEEMKAM
jgi:hypothetical protein